MDCMSYHNAITTLKCYSSNHVCVSGHFVSWGLEQCFWDACLGSHPGHTRVGQIVSFPFIVPAHNHSGAGLLPAHRPSSSQSSNLLRLSVLLAGDWGWRHREPFYLPYHKPHLVIVWRRHTCLFLLDTKPLQHCGKCRNGLASKGNPCIYA